MDFKLRIEERPSIELRDWMYNDVLVKLWESRPEFEKYREEGEEIDRERVKIDEKTELPCVENISKGMMKINFIDWLMKSPAVPSYSSSQKKKQQSQPAAGEGGAGASEEDKDPDVIHRLKYFYPEGLLLQPQEEEQRPDRQQVNGHAHNLLRRGPHAPRAPHEALLEHLAPPSG